MLTEYWITRNFLLIQFREKVLMHYVNELSWSSSAIYNHLCWTGLLWYLVYSKPKQPINLGCIWVEILAMCLWESWSSNVNICWTNDILVCIYGSFIYFWLVRRHTERYIRQYIRPVNQAELNSTPRILEDKVLFGPALIWITRRHQTVLSNSQGHNSWWVQGLPVLILQDWVSRC